MLTPSSVCTCPNHDAPPSDLTRESPIIALMALLGTCAVSGRLLIKGEKYANYPQVGNQEKKKKKNTTFPNESGKPVGVITAYWLLIALPEVAPRVIKE